MIKSDIFEIEIPQNEQIRTILNMKRLNNVFSETRLFEKTATILASRFSINSKIKQKLDSNPDYFITWQKMCSYLFSYLLGPARFFDRSDANELMCLPIVAKLVVDNSLQTMRAINVYNSIKRIGTLFFKDPEYDNEFSFYGQGKFKTHGSWASKVRNDVQNYNLYGLNKSDAIANTSLTKDCMKSKILEASNAFGSTITVKDLFSAIENIKKKYMEID